MFTTGNLQIAQILHSVKCYLKKSTLLQLLKGVVGIKCLRLHFLSLGILGQVASPLPRRLVFPLTLYGRYTRHSRVGFNSNVNTIVI